VLLVYTAFGFSLHSAQFVRLALHTLSICFLALTRKRYLGVRVATVLLLIIGLSPTLLYFNTVETSFGIDAEYLIVCLWLICSLDNVRPRLSYLVSAAIWCVALLASLSYPSFLVYVPGLAIVYHLKLRATLSTYRARFWRRLTIGVVSFAAPLVIVTAYVKNRAVLLDDPHTGSGLFRGGGGLLIERENVARAMTGIASDLFLRGRSYYFDLERPEFSDYYPVLGVIAVLSISTMLCLRQRNLRVYVGLALMTCLLSLLIVGLTRDGIWNRVTCHTLYGVDLKTHQFVPLDVRLWENYYFQH